MVLQQKILLRKVRTVGTTIVKPSVGARFCEAFYYAARRSSDQLDDRISVITSRESGFGLMY